MKICFFTKQNFYRDDSSGGCKMSEQLYELLKAIYGEKSVDTLIIDTKDSQDIPKNTEIIHIKSGAIKRNLNYLMLRDECGMQEKRNIVKKIRNSNYDIYFFDGSWLGSISRCIPDDKKVIAFYHNIEKALSWDRVRKDKGFIGFFRFMSNWINEKNLTQRANVRICLNKRDDYLLQENYKLKADGILPIVVKDVFKVNNIQYLENHTLLFVGSYFYPNVQGIRWFCESVMPFIECTLYIVGNGMEVLKNELERENIKVIGKVQDLSEYYMNADAVVMPIFAGGGMKVKTAEALMYGKTILATQEALEGYDTEMGLNIFKCEDAESFRKSINAFYAEQPIKKYCQANRELYLNKYSPLSVQNYFKGLIEESYMS